MLIRGNFQRSRAHRIACLALYRALLLECPHISIAPERQQALRKVVKKIFLRNKSIQGPEAVARALRPGYEALDLFRAAANGDTPKTSRILELLADLSPERVAIPTPIIQEEPHPTKRNIELKAGHRVPAPWPGATLVLSRPHLQISGRRHIPILTSANRVPFLRFKKPQSPYLSRVLRNKIEQKSTRYTKIEELKTTLGMARLEDEWDKIISDATEANNLAQGRLLSSGAQDSDSGPSYVDVINSVINWIFSMAHAEEMRRAEVAKKMQAIVDQERELAKAEELERIRKQSGQSLSPLAGGYRMTKG